MRAHCTQLTTLHFRPQTKRSVASCGGGHLWLYLWLARATPSFAFYLTKIDSLLQIPISRRWRRRRKLKAAAPNAARASSSSSSASSSSCYHYHYYYYYYYLQRRSLARLRGARWLRGAGALQSVLSLRRGRVRKDSNSFMAHRADLNDELTNLRAFSQRPYLASALARTEATAAANNNNAQPSKHATTRRRRRVAPCLRPLRRRRRRLRPDQTTHTRATEPTLLECDETKMITFLNHVTTRARSVPHRLRNYFISLSLSTNSLRLVLLGLT